MSPTAGHGSDGAWAETAAYEAYIGRWSRSIARKFVAWLTAPSDAEWLDVGCGSGALSEAILSRGRPSSLLALDRSERFVRHMPVPTGPGPWQAPGWAPRLLVGDAVALPLRARVVDVAACGLVLNFLASPAAGLGELGRVVRPGGTVAVYVWDYAGRMQLLRAFWDAAVSVDAAAARLDEGARFPICAPDALEALFVSAGLEDVEVAQIEAPTLFRDFEDLWLPFLGGQGPAPGYVASLTDLARDQLCNTLRRRLPVEPDGSIALVARAWAARGRVPRLRAT